MSEMKGVIAFLEAVAARVVLENSRDILSQLDNASFKSVVIDTALEMNGQLEHPYKIRQTGKQQFPSILINNFGAEIDCTNQDVWATNGIGIAETKRGEQFEQIILFFGKLGGAPSIRVRNYADCVKAITVSHSPRYRVDLNLLLGEDVFTKMGLSYDKFRNVPEPMLEIRKLIGQSLQPGDSLWWLDSNEETFSSPVLRNYSNLTVSEKRFFKIKAMALCPDIFGQGQNKYEKLPAMLLREFSCLSSNIRDQFSANGKILLSVPGIGEEWVRAVDKRLFDYAKDIQTFINDAPLETLKQYWGIETEPESRISTYSELIRSKTQLVLSSISPADIFLSAL